LSAHITLLAAEANVVATRRFWPRSFSPMIEQPVTQADKRAAEPSIAAPRRTTTAAPNDRGYAVVSALALAVEAVEALCTFLSDCDPGLTAAVRPFERAAL
jgi:hypothetical protein